MILRLAFLGTLGFLILATTFVGIVNGYGRDVEVDISWDFDIDGDFAGFANATTEENKMELRVENGELRGNILGKYFSREATQQKSGNFPHFDSPHLYLDVTERQYFAIRMMYFGAATNLKLFLKSGPDATNRAHLDHSRSDWLDTFTISSFFDSGSTSTHTRTALTDGDLYTYFESTTSTMVSIIFDLQSYRDVSSISILPFGDNRSPKRCILQRSLTSGVGPFETVTTFTMQQRGNYNSSDHNLSKDWSQFQTFRGFQQNGQYWKLIIMDNYGGSSVAIREVKFDGYREDVNSIEIPIENSGKYQNYYIPIFPYVLSKLLRFRLEWNYDPPKITSTSSLSSGESGGRPLGKNFREGVSIDYIRFVRAPDVWRVRGCLDKYSQSPDMASPEYNVTSITHMINGHLALRSFVKHEMSLPFASTYDCPLSGGVPIRIDGYNMGPKALVYIGGRPCPTLSFSRDEDDGRLETLVCQLPPLGDGDQSHLYQKEDKGVPGSSPASPLPDRVVEVRVENGVLPGLKVSRPLLQYRTAPPVPASPLVTNIGSYRVDLVWSPPGDDPLAHMAVTGYKIVWFQPKYPSRVSNITVGNVTTTSIRGLRPGTEYVFAIAAVSEGVYPEQAGTLPTDLYGRRDLGSRPNLDPNHPNPNPNLDNPNPNDALIGTFSSITNVTATLFNDFSFNLFNANATLNASSVPLSRSSDGPTGLWGSEGHFGLVMVGDANIQNCNVSSTCCDGYDPNVGLSSCGRDRSVCAVLPARMLAYDYVLDGVTRRQVPSNLPYSNGAPPEIVILTLQELIENKGAAMPKASCGPALRLTPSEARRSGSAWYNRKVNVREGFDTTISFQISNPSQRCDRLDDVNTYCRSRGADGWAFVLQNVGPLSLGTAGRGLGYEGIFNSLAVEIDTYHNFENMDYYENHISVMTQGWRFNISANHSRSLATSTKVPDLTDGIHKIRIRYDPVFDENAVPHPSFQVNGFSSYFIENADFANGGQGDWGIGFGLLYVYFDDMYSPVITTPLNLEYTLHLDDGRALVGITAATGDNHWQTHDILSWSFSSLYRDIPYYMPLVVNDQGDHRCVDEVSCVHNVDYMHFMRTNKEWGPGFDNLQGWQSGTEGVCTTC